MNLERLLDRVIAECDYCGKPIHAGDLHRSEYTYQVTLGGEHGTCGEEHGPITAEAHEQRERAYEESAAFSGAFKRFYCGGEE